MEQCLYLGPKAKKLKGDSSAGKKPAGSDDDEDDEDDDGESVSFKHSENRRGH